MLLLDNHREMVNARKADRLEVELHIESELELCDELHEITDAEIAAWDAERDAMLEQLIVETDTIDDLELTDVEYVDPLSVVGSPERQAALAKIAERIAREEE